MMMGWVLLYL